jgi:ABC-type antimicrobial peptide transport system permease subunit
MVVNQEAGVVIAATRAIALISMAWPARYVSKLDKMEFGYEPFMKSGQ